MNLEQHVTNLEISKKLQELGVPQVSNFYWANNQIVIEIENQIPTFSREDYFGNFELVIDDPGHGCCAGTNDEPIKELYSAYLLSELIELLGDKFHVFEYYVGKKLIACSPHNYIEIKSTTPIQATANLVIKLTEEGVLSFKKDQ